jgi:FtsP/CotA-like multicopper oxidase with cupredoxin domain
MLAPAAGAHRGTLTVQEVVREVAPGVTQPLWTFGGEAPGPGLHGRVGDTFEITLGHATQYRAEPLTARVRERVRVWVLDAGPSRPSSFHVVGGQLDTVYSEGANVLGGPTPAGAPAGAAGIGGAQALGLLPGQRGFVELTFPEAGRYPFVSHIMVDAEPGAAGAFEVTSAAD